MTFIYHDDFDVTVPVSAAFAHIGRGFFGDRDILDGALAPSSTSARGGCSSRSSSWAVERPRPKLG